MIKIVHGDLFESKATVLVNPVNCVGVSGKGLAKEFAKRFPKQQKLYEKACRNDDLNIGDIFLIETGETAPARLVYFPTKEHWRDKSRITWITRGLKALRENLLVVEVESIAVPALGCGNGGLAWEPVKDAIVDYLADLPIDVMLYGPME
jgi:O-acetyl-ADP-ribose deacetylase (regulator of RNase III)